MESESYPDLFLSLPSALVCLVLKSSLQWCLPGRVGPLFSSCCVRSINRRPCGPGHQNHAGLSGLKMFLHAHAERERGLCFRPLLNINKFVCLLSLQSQIAICLKCPTTQTFFFTKVNKQQDQVIILLNSYDWFLMFHV